jgi:hypothetical protein
VDLRGNGGIKVFQQLKVGTASMLKVLENGLGLGMRVLRKLLGQTPEHRQRKYMRLVIVAENK